MKCSPREPGELCQPLVGWICTLRPRVLVVYWVRSGQAAQTAAGNWTLPPGTNGIAMLLGQVSSCWSKSMVHADLANPGPLRTGNASPKILRSSLRSWTRLLDR